MLAKEISENAQGLVIEPNLNSVVKLWKASASMFYFLLFFIYYNIIAANKKNSPLQITGGFNL